MITETMEDYQDRVESEVKTDFLNNDTVATSIKYARFLSKSKGIRNGIRRLRRVPKEIHLVKYMQGFTGWTRFPFDIYATEIIGQHADGEDFKERIISLWGY